MQTLELSILIGLCRKSIPNWSDSDAALTDYLRQRLRKCTREVACIGCRPVDCWTELFLTIFSGRVTSRPSYLGRSSMFKVDPPGEITSTKFPLNTRPGEQGWIFCCW